MHESLYPYYERELVFIRQLGQEFARRYPAAAGRLMIGADRINDPHVERLIESFALLSGRIHHKLDDEFPELTDALLGVLYPHYLAPIPSMGIVQFDLDADRTDARRVHDPPPEPLENQAGGRRHLPVPDGLPRDALAGEGGRRPVHPAPLSRRVSAAAANRRRRQPATPVSGRSEILRPLDGAPPVLSQRRLPPDLGALRRPLPASDVDRDPVGRPRLGRPGPHRARSGRSARRGRFRARRGPPALSSACASRLPADDRVLRVSGQVSVRRPEGFAAGRARGSARRSTC